MCELFAMSARHPSRLTISLEEFSKHGDPTAKNRDGWGMAWYDERDVLRMRQPSPLGQSAHLQFIHEHQMHSTTVLAHIRQATQGERKLCNTQPFIRELGGCIHTFAHNGDLKGIHEAIPLQTSRFRRVGDTDSEHAFCLLLEQLEALWLAHEAPPSIEARCAVFLAFAERLRPFGPANFLYADGELLFVHGHKRTQPATGQIEPPGLHFLCRACEPSETGTEIKGLHIDASALRQKVLLVASVPLSDEDWQPLKEGETRLFVGGECIGQWCPSPQQ